MRVTQMSASSRPKKYPPPSPPPVLPVSNKLNISHFKADDWILLAIIAALILEGSDDYILLIALGYLFWIGL